MSNTQQTKREMSPRVRASLLDSLALTNDDVDEIGRENLSDDDILTMIHVALKEFAEKEEAEFLAKDFTKD